MRDVKNPNWASAIKMNPHNLFAPSVLNGAKLDDATEGNEGGDGDVQDVVDVGITVPEFNVPDEMTSWCRSDDEGSNVDASVIHGVRGGVGPAPHMAARQGPHPRRGVGTAPCCPPSSLLQTSGTCLKK